MEDKIQQVDLIAEDGLKNLNVNSASGNLEVKKDLDNTFQRNIPKKKRRKKQS